MKHKRSIRFFSLVLTLCMLLGMIPAFTAYTEVEAEAVSGVNSLDCSGFISNSTAREYINMMMRYYINSNTNLQTTLDDGKSVVFMFEGGSDNYWNGSDYTNSAYDTRDQAVVIVVKKNSSGNAYIAFYSENCSSIPGDPSWCTSGVAYSGSVSIYDGVYRFYRWDHTGPYAAFQLEVSNGLYTPLSNPNGEQMGCSGINIHTRASNIAAGSDLGWAWSEGCQVIGSGDTSSNVYNSFFQSIMNVDWNPWVSYYSSPKQIYSYGDYGYGYGSSRTEGYYVVDRQLGLLNASGTSYGSGSLINLYNKTALGKLTAKSATAKTNALASQDYKTKCTRYNAHCKIQVKKDGVDIMTQPSTYSTANNSSALEAVANGTTLTATGVYLNTGSNYWYEVIAPSGKTGYIYSNQVNYISNLTSDIKLSGASYPNGHVKGNYFTVSGTIKSTYSGLTKVGLNVRSGFGTSGTVVTGGSASIGNKSYSMAGSAIDNATLMNELAVGNYTYQFYATYKNYYATDNKTLMSTTGTVNLSEKYFAVISSSVSQSSCTHSNKTVTVNAATCTTSGKTATVCSKCGKIAETTVAAAHSYGSWSTTLKPTCTTAGTQQRTCSKCSNIETKSVAASGHSYTPTENSGTCQDHAHTEYICGGCGDSYKEYPKSDWSTVKPTGVDESIVESKKQYRYSDYETVTSYDTSMSGYTLKSSAWVQSGTGTVNYVNSWPSGFYTGNAYYTKYNNKSNKVTASETDTTKTTINSDAAVGYLYYHWCYTDSFYSVESKSGSYTTFHCYYQSTKSYTDYDSSDGSYEAANSSCCSNSDWYWIVEVKAQKYTNYKKQFTYERWKDYTAWSDTAVTASATRKVENRTVYRYVTSALGSHAWNNGTCTICSAACNHNWVDAVCGTCGKTCTHLWSNGTCTICGATCDHGWNSGKCENCGAFCSHNWNNGICGICGIACVHEWNNGTCGICGTACVHQWDDGTCGGCHMTCTHTWSHGTCTTCGKSCTHTWSSGACAACGKVCVHYWTDGICGTCGTVCGHTYENGACVVCGKACAHSWESGICTVCGTVCDHSAGGSTCPTCGETLLNPTIKPVTPTLALESEVQYWVYYTISDMDDVDPADMGMIYWSAPQSEGTVDTAEYRVSGAAKVGSYYIVRTNGIPAKELGDSCYMKIYAKLSDGTYVYSSMLRFSAKTYAETILASNADAKLKQTCVALLNYGAAAQTYFNYKAYNLMNSGLTEAQKALISDYDSTMVEGITKVDSSKIGSFAKVSGGFTSVIPSVSLGGAFSVNYYFVPAKAPAGKMTFYYWDLETYNAVGVLTPENALGAVAMTPNEDGEYWASFDKIAAKELGDTIFVAAVYESGGVRYCSGVLACNVSAVAAMQMSTGTLQLQALAQELLVYGYYAKNYFGS